MLKLFRNVTLFMYNTSQRKEVFFLKKDKRKALELLKQKNNGEIKITYKEISLQSGYSRMQLSRLVNEIEKKILNLY